jgi:TPR repeat protein
MGDPDAQTDLGNFYLTGQGVPMDKVRARHWYEQAVVHRQRNAAFILGQMYWYGDTVERSDAEAFRYWEIAWEAGRPDAALLLARSHVVVAVRDPQNIERAALETALQWYELAMPHLEGTELDSAREEQGDVRDALDTLARSQDQE